MVVELILLEKVF